MTDLLDDGTMTEAEIAAHPMTPLLVALQSDPLYATLCATFVAGEGNLLEMTEPRTVLRQLATLAWAIDTHRPRAATVTLAEVGFHKGFFTLLLRHLLPDAELHVYANDIRPESARAAELLNAADRGLAVDFTPGDSRLVWADVLERIGRPADIAWIDGGHEAGVLSSDLALAMEYGARLILVDDATWLPALHPVIADCANRYGYRRITAPTPPDRRGIAILVPAR